MTPEEAPTHKNRHALLRAVGTEPTIEIDTEWLTPEIGDVYMLCSDGLDNHVSDVEIHELLAAHGPSEAAWKLVAKALIGGGSDNCTVIVVRLDELEPS